MWNDDNLKTEDITFATIARQHYVLCFSVPTGIRSERDRRCTRKCSVFLALAGIDQQYPRVSHTGLALCVLVLS
jgi:hypothetical protein